MFLINHICYVYVFSQSVICLLIFLMCLVTQLCQTLFYPMCSLPGSSVHGYSPGKITALLQGIFPTQGLNPGFLHCRWILYYLSHQGSLIFLMGFFFLSSQSSLIFILFGGIYTSLLLGLFSSYSKWGLLSSCSSGTQASYYGSFSCCRTRALGQTDFSSCCVRAQ